MTPSPSLPGSGAPWAGGPSQFVRSFEIGTFVVSQSPSHHVLVRWDPEGSLFPAGEFSRDKTST